MADDNPIEIPTEPIPTVSVRAIPIAGLHVDVYGLDELSASAVNISCLWLEHPRMRRKEDMADTAHLVLSAFHHKQKSGRFPASRGLIAVAFDQRNHGTRVVDQPANDSWRKGNLNHAQDMFSCVSGTANDTSHLMDVIEAYVFPASPARIDQHLALGVSLGGHVVWHLLFREPRLTSGVAVIGCPDYMWLMRDRARLSKIENYLKDDGASFYGSTSFPAGLVETCKAYDPKGILFGTGSIPSETPSAEEQQRLRSMLDTRIKGKRFQILSGGKDKLVPYRASKMFLDFFKDAVASWYKDGNVFVEDNVYPEAAHEFNKAMGKDALRFILDSVALADNGGAASPKM